MSEPLDPTLRTLNDCGCCSAQSGADPSAVLMEIDNAPGLPAIAYRIGDQARFKRSLLDALAHTLERPALGGLTTRAGDDFAIALLDAWACLADVLTFYQERIANENYLRTALERRSLAYLARLINYQPRPGVAAHTWLAFTLDKDQGPLIIATGARAQSIPGPGELPQTYETVQSITADARWNEMRPRRAYRQRITTGMPAIYLKGAPPNLRPGDHVLLREEDGDWAVRSIARVTPNDQPGLARVDFDPQAGATSALPSYDADCSGSASLLADALAAAPASLTAQFVQSYLLFKAWDAADLLALAENRGWSPAELVNGINPQLVLLTLPVGEAHVFRQRAGLFGCTAPAFSNLRNSLGESALSIYGFNWDSPAFTVSDYSWRPQINTDTSIILDAPYPAITIGSWLYLEGGGKNALYKVVRNQETGLTMFTVSGHASWLWATIQPPQTKAIETYFSMRGTSVLAQSEALPLAEMPDTRPVAGDTIALDGFYGGLRAGQAVIVSGERADAPGLVSSEDALLSAVHVVDGFTVLKLDHLLDHPYRRDSVKINANVALATHGETVQETLGSGDAGQAFQSFSLKRAPLTYVRAALPGGAQSTLEVRVNDVLWHEVASFVDQGPNDQVYLTRQAENGITRVVFGDGMQGARPPTGLENIRATYRAGIGQAGNQAVMKISLLARRPVGVKEVTNPVPAAQGDDPESAAQIRRNAPRGVLALDRIVSLHDYEDFAASFAGISKALATWTWSGAVRGVFLTLAGPGGEELPGDSQAVKDLLDAVLRAGDPYIPVRATSYKRSQGLFQVTGRIKVNPDYLPNLVLEAVRQALRAAFSFEARDFGQPVYLSEVIAVMQAVAGVEAVDLDGLFRSSESPTRRAVLLASAPSTGIRLDRVAGVFKMPDPAELLVLDPRPILLQEMA